MSRTCARRIAWWWPPMLAAFALSLFAAVALATGTAWADDGASGSRSPGSAGSSQSGKPADKTTADKTTADKTTADKTTADKTTADKTTADKTTADKTTADKTTADKTTADKTTSDKTTSDKTTSDKTTSDKTTSDKTTSDKTTSDKTTSDKTTSDKTTSDKTTSDKTTSDKTTSDKTTSDKTTSDKTTSDKTTSDKTTSDKTTSDKTTSDKTTSDKTTTGTTTLSSKPSTEPPTPDDHHRDTAAPVVAVDPRRSSPDDQDQPPAPTLRLVSAATTTPAGNKAAAVVVLLNPGQRLEQSVQQFIGLASDVGIVGASLVNNIAAQTALVIGPAPLFGLPYAISTGIAGTAGNISKALSGTPLDATSVGPFAVNYGVLNVLSFFTPTKVPAGANDPSILVSAAHPLPIILVNGTVETQDLDWSVGAPVLANAGYKVYTFNYGNPTPFPDFPIQSITDIRGSAAELSAEVNMVLAETGATKVILIGHSQGGGITPAYYVDNLGGADKVSQFIGLAPSNHGTDLDGLVGLQMLPIVGPLLFQTIGLIGPALIQQTVTSPFQQEVYGNGDTRPGVSYTTISSIHDEVVTPYTQQALSGPDVTNIVLQDQYPNLLTGHIGVAVTQPAWAAVLNALATNQAASPLQNPQLTAA